MLVWAQMVRGTIPQNNHSLTSRELSVSPSFLKKKNLHQSNNRFWNTWPDRVLPAETLSHHLSFLGTLALASAARPVGLQTNQPHVGVGL